MPVIALMLGALVGFFAMGVWILARKWFVANKAKIVGTTKL